MRVIAKDSVKWSEMGGFGGGTHKLWIKYMQLSKIATDLELLKLSIYPSVIVRAYAFQALLNHNSPYIINYVKLIENDIIYYKEQMDAAVIQF